MSTFTLELFATESIEKVGISAMKVGGEQNLSLGQVASDFDLGSVLKLNQSVNHQPYNLLAGFCKRTAAHSVLDLSLHYSL